MRPLILLNGPPGSGKDTLAQHLRDKNRNFEILHFAKILKERTHALYGNSLLEYDYFDGCKNKPNDFFLGLTPRQAYINVSEVYIKPIHGTKFFGDALVKTIRSSFYLARGFITADSGFAEEAEPVINCMGRENTLLVRIRDRGSFANDSRSFIELPVNTLDISNDRSELDFLNIAEEAIGYALQSMSAEKSS